MTVKAMNFTDLDLKHSYKSLGDNSITDNFLIPALKCSKKYMRSVGFFSSGVISTILEGIISLSRRGGTVQLVASPRLSQDDIDAITLGYEKREELIKTAFQQDFVSSLDAFDDQNLNLLVELITHGTLDIKIAVTEGYGDYHDKLGILEDQDGNMIVFYGSPNSSINGYKRNYEKVRLAFSWIPSEKEIVKDEYEEFLSIWNGTNNFLKVYDYSDCAKANLLQVVEERKAAASGAAPIKLRDYQSAAIQAWIENDYHGFYVMATGTGKTWTAIFSAKALIEKEPVTIVICAPYKHLVKQWAEDVKKAFPDAIIIMVSSENQSWQEQISSAIIRKRYKKETQIIIISTIVSFNTPRFKDTISKETGKKLLIVDEAHRFTNRPEELKTTYQYMLGLSATPYSGTSAVKGKELMSFFDGQVFSLTIEEALSRGFLVPYYYRPIFVNTSGDEEEKFQYYTSRIVSCFDQRGRCIDPDKLVKAMRSRLRVISMVGEKQTRINEIIEQIPEKDHFVVYCGDGRLFDGDSGEEVRHIQAIKKVLYEHGIKSSQFTATEDMNTRMELVTAFNTGDISSLAAIRCLDEGINIPSIKSALILSSNDDYREFVQRRGRILRLYPGKPYATIYDVVVLPSMETPGMAKIEFRRFLEYARLALNWHELEPILHEYLDYYSLSEEDVDVYDYEGMEDLLDE